MFGVESIDTVEGEGDSNCRYESCMPETEVVTKQSGVTSRVGRISIQSERVVVWAGPRRLVLSGHSDSCSSLLTPKSRLDDHSLANGPSHHPVLIILRSRRGSQT